MKYKIPIVLAFFESEGLPKPEVEFKFHPERKWRFDFAWPENRLAVEIQGSIFSGGRHTRGAALVKEYEKLNNAAMGGWRVMFFQPSEICLVDTVKLIKQCLGL